MSEQTIDLKGSLFTLSVLHLTQNDLSQLEFELKRKISQAPSFFYRAPVVVNIEQLEQQQIDFIALKMVIQALDFVLVGISGGTPEQKEHAKEVGLAVLNLTKDPVKTKTATETTAESVIQTVVETVIEKQIETVEKIIVRPSKEIKQNVRSGQQVYAQDSNLVILGSVAHGAEVVADGDIHIYGTLRGRALAGAKGKADAKIYCQNLQAELVSICGNYKMSEALQQDAWDQSASIELSDEKLIINVIN
ncbi:MAG: septum site-determining protein MinC [Phenylobacterium sp.]|jgi:septum site-determining protein MinC